MALTTRSERAEAHYRNAMRQAMRGLLELMNPKDIMSYPHKYDDLVQYTLDWLKTEQQESAEIPDSPGSAPAKGSGASLSLEE